MRLISLFLLILCFGPIKTIAQSSCVKVLQANYGGNGDDIALDVVDAGNGQFYMVGNTNSFGAGGTDILVVKMDASKKILWSNTYGVSGNETIRKASPSADGGLLITGQTNSFANSAGDILCMKVKPDGSLQWVRTFGVGSSNGDLGSDIIQTSDGGYAINCILNTAGFVADGLVIKLDANANRVWAKRFKTAIGEDGSSIIESGNKLIATFDIERQSGLDYAMAISELQTSNGQVLSTKRIISNSKGIFRPIIYKDFGTGYWISGHLIAESNYSQMEQVILHLNSAYNITKTYKLVKSPLTNDFYTGFAPLKSGGFITCASEPASAGGKGHIYKIAADGKVVFAKQVSTSGRSSLNALALSGGKIIAVGSEDHAGNSDFYLADFDSTGNNADLCSIDTSIVSVQDHPFTVENFSWTTVSNENFSNTPQIFSTTPQTIISNAICTKDTCVVAVIAPDFDIPDSVCVNESINITNKTVGATTNYWSFCVADLNNPPVGDNLGNVDAALSAPVFMDYAYDNGNYYGYLINHNPGGLVRLDFGNSLLNKPTATNLGNFGEILPPGSGTEGIQLIKNEGKWYAIIVGGNINTGSVPRIAKIEFGTSLSNPNPVATSWGNVGNMDQPLDLHVFKEGDNFYGFTLSAENNTITRFNFSSSFDNLPTATNLGNIGNLSYPTGIYAINDNGFWRVFVVNGGDNTRVGGVFSLTRLDFGNSLLNTPVGINLGNPNGLLKHPRDLTIMKSCGQIIGFAVNGHPDFKEIIKFDFNDDLSKTPSATSLGNVGNVDFPHSISKLFRVNNDLYSFITNVANNTVTRLQFAGCTDASIPNSTLKNPPAIKYTVPGIYNINLTIDDGLATQNSICKQIVVQECNKVTIDFTIPDTVCVNTPVSITNKSVGATTNYWSFCVADLNSPPVGENLGNTGNLLQKPVYIDYVFDNGNYYGFVVNNYPGGLSRLDFGNSLLNTPVATSLGDVNGVILNTAEGIQVVKNKGKWYAVIVGGTVAANVNPFICTIDIGTNIKNNNPTGKNWGNVGNMAYPHDIYLFEDNSRWYGITANYDNNTITRFDFTSDLSNTPTGINLGNIGNLSGPTGVQAIKDEAGQWLLFVTNATSSTLSRLSFGTSLLNTPTGVNLGNLNNTFSTCWDIYILKYCGTSVGYVINAGDGTLVKIDFQNSLLNTPSAVNFGNIGSLSFPHSISKIFRVGADLFTFITNVDNNTITRLHFDGCTNASIPNTTLKNPPAIKYALPGNYNINLTVDDGLPTQASLCRQVVVLAAPIIDFSYQQDVCNPLQVKFFGSDSSGQMVWDFGDGSPLSNLANPTHVFGKAGSFNVRFSLSGACPSTIEKTIVVSVVVSNIIQNKDTVICENGSVQLMADAAAEYCWTPATYLSNSYIGNPIAKPLKDITYSLVSKTVGTNLVVNGDFTNGNTAFSSAYNYATANLTEGQFFVGNNPKAWNGALSSCADHTTGGGNMLLINGSPQTDVEVWSQSITVTPNTNFEFSTWVQALWTPNPAKLQFSINGVVLGETITAALPTCTWSRFNTNWNSGTSTTAVISIVNKNTEIQGNDFALDDISFAPITYKRDSVKITIDKPFIKTSNDTAVCAGSPVPLKTVGGATYSWSSAAGLSNTSIGNPIATVTDTTRYIVTGTNAKGCIAKDTVVISIIPSPSINISNDTAICGAGSVQLAASGAVSYQWSPGTSLNNPAIANPLASPLTTTKYQVKAEGANGCSATDSVTVQVLPNLVINVSNDTLVCGNSKVQLFATGAISYKWSPSLGLSNSNISNPTASPLVTTKYVVTASNNQCSTTDSVTIALLPAPVVSLSADTAICKEGGASLVASGGISYAWSPSAGLSSTVLPNPIATPASTTKYKVTVTGANTCTATDSVIVRVLPAPVVILSKDTSICGVGSVPLMASGGISYVWSPSLGLSSSLIANPLASPTISTAYQVKVTGANTCTANGSVLVNVLPALVTSISNDTAVCVKSKAQLVVTGGSKYQWTPSTGLNNAFIANPIASPAATTVYTVKITGANNCMATESVTVTMLTLPVIGLSNDTVICRSGSIELKATGGSAYQWSPAATLSNPLIANPFASPTVSTTYTVLATGENSCSVTDSVSVSVRPAPQFGIVNTNLIGCENQPIQLGAFGGDTYSWSPSMGLSSAAIANPIAKLQTDQSFTVIISESICKEQASFVVPVAIRPLPAVIVSKSNDITCNTPFAQLNTNIVGRNYSWTPATGLSNIAIANPLANPATPTTYTVSVLDSNGCISKGSVAVKVYNNNDFRLYQMPNAFTPDRNGNNDCFGVTKWGTVRIVYFEIYNRWGQQVFAGNSSRQCWDGTLNGQPQPTGNFVYKIKVETMCGVVEKKGNVVLIR